jgi:hypothetical protein
MEQMMGYLLEEIKTNQEKNGRLTSRNRGMAKRDDVLPRSDVGPGRSWLPCHSCTA